METMERFMRFVERGGTNDKGCWLWGGAEKGNGYGAFLFGGKSIQAHRASYIMHKGEIPPKHDVCHKCDVRMCVNPDHLFAGTRLQNMQDCKRKGRIARGAMLGDRRGGNSSSAKLTWDDVREIRASDLSRVELAKIYNVDPTNISMIVRGKTWKE